MERVLRSSFTFKIKEPRALNAALKNFGVCPTKEPNKAIKAN
tara:strand:+ start:254 stop:379 length:126 start_codon:yes stop_codon:yes gene_type:complete